MKKIIPFKKDIIFKTNLAEITSISLEHTLHKEDEQLVTGEFIISGNYKISDNSINVDNFSYNLNFDINIDEKYNTDKIEIDIDDFYYEIVNNNVLSVNIDVVIDKLEDKPLIDKHEEEQTKSEEKIEVYNEVLDVDEKIDANNELLLDADENIDEGIRIAESETNDLFDELLVASVEEKENKPERCIEDENLENVTSVNNYDEDIRKKSKNIEMKIENKVEKKELKEEKIMKEQVMNNNDNQIKSLFTTFDSESETYATYKVYLVREGDNLESIMQKYEIDRETLSYYNDLNDLKIGDKLIIPTVLHA